MDGIFSSFIFNTSNNIRPQPICYRISDFLLLRHFLSFLLQKSGIFPRVTDPDRMDTQETERIPPSRMGRLLSDIKTQWLTFPKRRWKQRGRGSIWMELQDPFHSKAPRGNSFCLTQSFQSSLLGFNGEHSDYTKWIFLNNSHWCGQPQWAFKRSFKGTVWVSNLSTKY